MEKIQNLLNQVSIIIKKNDELLDATSGRFNVFSLCNIDHYETKHSQIIAEFLNPKGSHGFGNQFLDAFMEIIKGENRENEEIKGIKLNDNAKVKTEHGEGVDGRIDILISDEENAVIIENKIYATDQCEQLIRYNQFAEKYNSIILYLTLYGCDASEKSSGKNLKYSKISYKDTITKWLDRCIQISALRPIVRETLLQYKNHINKLTGDNIESKFKNELINICSKQENIEAAFAIFKSQDIKLKNEGEIINSFSEQEQEDIAAYAIFTLQDQIKNKIIETHLIPQLKKIAEERDIKFCYEGFKSTNYREKYNKNLYFKKWKYVELWFQFQDYYNDLGYGIRCIENNKEELLKNKGIEDAFNKLEKDKGAKWCTFKYMQNYRNWNSEAFIDMTNGKLAKEIEKVIDDVLEIVDDLDL